MAYLNGGFPANKLVAGVPFYGRAYANVTNSNNGLYQSFSGAPMGTFETGVFDYEQLKSSYVGLNGFSSFRHAEAKVPWLFNPTSRIFISYDDPTSLIEKSTYIRSKSLAGVMFWEISQDDAQHSLLNTLRSEMSKP